MNIMRDVPLKLYSTMRLGGTADHLVEISSKEDLEEALNWAELQKKPVIMIGHGSNIVWKDEGFRGLIIVNKIKGFKKLLEDKNSATYRIGAGEEWDDIVGRLANKGLSGVECLSLIPGTAGATPVQNVGAYGQEIASTLQTVEAYDTVKQAFVTIPAADCAFAYRTSRFKTSDKGRYFIKAITLKLSKSEMKPPFYQSLQKYLDEHGITSYDPSSLREAVIAIRRSRMPDWKVIPTNGSFFANPIISRDKFEELKKDFPDIVAWEYEGGYKLAAGWLMEKAGFKGYEDTETGMATWPKQALVLVNQSAHKTADLLKFKQKIVKKVEEMFGITLEQEPELLP